MGTNATPEGAAVQPHLNDADWRELSRLVYETVGIKLSEAKRTFLVSRLLRRLRATHTSTFREYLELLRRSYATGQRGELQQFINAVTTNKTDFFREPEHFVVLETWLRERWSSLSATRRSGLRVWCAAASTGEEPYTIAAVLQDCLTATEFERLTIVASDVDTQVLEVARRGVYKDSVAKLVSAEYRAKMFVRGRGDYKDHYRIRRLLREKVQFIQQNLVAPNWVVGERFDVVFCRNVLIYFDRETQQEVVRRLLGRTERDGLLFLGHSESLSSLSIPAKSIAHSVYAPVFNRSTFPRTVSALPKRSSHPSLHRVPRKPHGETLLLERGEVRLNAEKWLELVLEESFLLLVYAESASAYVVAHLDNDGLKDASQVVHETIECLTTALGTRSTKKGSFCAKVLLTDEARKDHIVSTTDECAIDLKKALRVPNRTRVWVEPHSARIIVRRAKLLG
jgi:chemotaxis protein methyltransferase CheR